MAAKSIIGAVSAVLMLGGCASDPLPSLTTGSLFGAKPDAAAAAAKAAEPKNDPMSRTLQVARIAARAQRCGFNFDPQRLKSNFMASEGAQPGADAAELGKLDHIYDSAFNGTLKATSKTEDYCTELRSAHIKAELGRHLAGDFTPGKAFKDPNDKGDEGLFSGWFGSGGNSNYKGTTLPTNNL